MAAKSAMLLARDVTYEEEMRRFLDEDGPERLGEAKKTTQVINLLSSSPPMPKRRGRASKLHAATGSDSSPASQGKLLEDYAEDSIDEDCNDGAVSSMPVGLGWVQKKTLRRSPRRAGSLPVASLQDPPASPPASQVFYRGRKGASLKRDA
jgi:hypothetical protein